MEDEPRIVESLFTTVWPASVSFPIEEFLREVSEAGKRAQEAGMRDIRAKPCGCPECCLEVVEIWGKRSENVHERREREQKAAQERENRRQQYEELKAEFEPPEDAEARDGERPKG